MGEEFVLAFQLGHVRVSFRFLVKEASLPEKQGFKSCQGVTVFPKEMQGEGFASPSIGSELVPNPSARASTT